MIISASRRTDIPAFYSDWFMCRINEGYVIQVNPFNYRQTKPISLAPNNIEAIIFWTKNPLPILQHLKLLNHLGYNYLFLVTLNSYPDFIEPGLPALPARLENFKRLSAEIGPDRVIWRYDPILISNFSPVSYHLAKFQLIAEQLSGFTKKVIISFFDAYRKANSKLNKLIKSHGLQITDIRDSLHQAELAWLATGLRGSAANHGLEIQTCSEKRCLIDYGIKPGSCIDSAMLNKLFSLTLTAAKDKCQRPECLCSQAADIGFYNTCRYNCSYCYATSSNNAVAKNLARHDSNSPSLIATK